MKKQIKFIILMVIFILAGALTVNAADVSVNINPSSIEAAKGDTFSITLNVATEAGINGVMTDFTYDEEKLELVTKEIVDTTKWTNLGENLSFAVLHNTSDTETNADIIKLTFKVKTTTEVGTTKITANNITIDTDETENSTYEIGAKEVQVTINEKQEEQTPQPGTSLEKTLTKIEVTAKPTKTTYKVGEKFDKTGMVITATYSDGTTKPVTNYAYSIAELKLTDTKIIVTYTENGITKTADVEITVTEKTTANQNENKDNPTESNNQTEKENKEKLPYTGMENNIIIIISILLVISAVSFISYKKIIIK